jgi:PAS domain S-box-containing protein
MEPSHLTLSFLEHAPLAIVAVNEAGALVFANQQAGSLFGRAVEEMIGLPVESLIPASLRERHPALVQHFFREPRPRVMGVGREVRAIDHGGREFPVEIGLTPIQTAEGAFVVAAIADITVRKHLEREVTAAKLVQEAMLPKAFPQTKDIETGGANRFADAAGGDFLDCVVDRDGEATLIIGDASGHGFAAALVSVAAKSYLRALHRTHRELGELLTHVNQLLIEDLAEGRFVTLFVGHLDVATRRFRYAGAGHVGYVLSREGRLKTQLVSTGPPLGWFQDAAYTVGEAEVEAGDCVLMMTDGIEESFGESGGQFGRDRIFQVFAAHANQAASQQAQAVLDAVIRFTNGKVQDDMTVLVARMR